MTFRALTIISLGLCAVGAFGYWRYKEADLAKPAAHVVIIRDLSDSIPDDCAPVVNLTKRALTLDGVGGSSTITLLGTGSKATANEPQKLEQLLVPDIKLVIEGKRRADQRRSELIDKMKGRCAETRTTKASPIFQAVKRGVEHLQGLGNGEAQRYLFVQTDGEEYANTQIMKALNQRPGTKLALPSPINNEGVRVVFCGIAETTVDMSAGGKLRPPAEDRAERRREVWGGLFVRPELVSFEPFCGEMGRNDVGSLAVMRD